MDKQILCRPFLSEQVKTRPGQHGKTLSYISTSAVIARLIEGCDAWSFELVKHEVLENEVIVVGKLTADGIVKMAFGGSSVTKDNSGKEVSLADDLKSASSDCLKKCASLLGVGLELYGAPTPTAVNNEKPRTVMQTPDVGDRLTSRQLAAIHETARRRGIGNGQLQTLLQEKFGKNEPQYLTKKEASELISEWVGANGAAA
jgi:hypothetical protein